MSSYNKDIIKNRLRKITISVLMVSTMFAFAACGSKSNANENSKSKINVEIKEERENDSKNSGFESLKDKGIVEENNKKQEETKEEEKKVEDIDKDTVIEKKEEVKEETKTENTTNNNIVTVSNKDSEVANKFPDVKKVEFNANNNVIVIDPGHANKSNHEKEPISPGSSTMKIKDGGGATGAFTGVPEYKIAMAVSMKLKPLLEAKGYKVIMTKTSHDENLGNVERAEIGNNAGAALVIRMHADSAGVEQAHGASMLIPGLNEHTAAVYDESKRCGAVIINTLTSQVGMYNRGLVPRQDITGFNWSKVPVVLVEMGFLSNQNEDNLLNADEYQDKIAKGIADGIEKALPINKDNKDEDTKTGIESEIEDKKQVKVEEDKAVDNESKVVGKEDIKDENNKDNGQEDNIKEEVKQKSLEEENEDSVKEKSEKKASEEKDDEKKGKEENKDINEINKEEDTVVDLDSEN